MIRVRKEAESDTWVPRTGWVTHLKGFDRTWLVGLLLPPTDGGGDDIRERQLAYIQLAIQRVI